MSETRLIRLELSPGRALAEIPFAGDGRWRAIFSLHAAGHMGRETAERRENRARLFGILGLDPARVFGVTQVHGRVVLEVEGGTPAEFASREADGLVTGRPEVVLSVTVADCLPVLLYSKRAAARGLVHSGWKGTGIVTEAVRLLREKYGVPAGTLHAVLGPCIGACCYAVDRERYERFTAEFGPESGLVRNGKCFLDLRRANLSLLESLGVKTITVIDNCTCCEPALGSYRRDGRDGYHNMIVLFGSF
jgi:YfiH family protein